MTSIAYSLVNIQTSSQFVPSTPSWFGEVVLIIEHLRKQGVLTKLSERVRFRRRRFGHYEAIDFLAVLFGRPLSTEKQTGGLVDRKGVARIVFDVDGTREAARQRALPQTEELPPAFRRLDEICAPGYTGRKRGEIVRTRTVISQAHSSQWLGSFGNRGNGRYRAELRQALLAVDRYLASHHLSQAQALLRFDGQYGTGAVIADLGGFLFVMRGKDYTVLDHPLVQARLHLPPDQFLHRPESSLVRSLYDCPEVPVGKDGRPLPRGGGNSSCGQKEESDWRHAGRPGL